MKIIKCIVIAAMLHTPIAAANGLNCDLISSLAEQTMMARQSDVPMRRLLQASSDDPILVYLIEEAYKYSVLDSPEYIQKYISQFSDRIYRECRNVNKK